MSARLLFAKPSPFLTVCACVLQRVAAWGAQHVSVPILLSSAAGVTCAQAPALTSIPVAGLSAGCKMSLFDVATRIPLLIRAPWLAASHGQKTQAFADAVDIFQVIPPVLSLFTLLRAYLAHFFPVFSRLLRVFTVSPRRFQRASSRNPGPRNSRHEGQEGRTPPFVRHARC